jgi:hypothetical protein
LGGKLLAPSLNDLSVSVPASSSSDGQKGDFAYDTNYIYISTENNTWKKAPLLNFNSDLFNLIDQQTFVSSTTYNVNSSAKIILVECIGAGGGGGAGGKSPDNYYASGGGGGAGGGYWTTFIPASILDSNVTVIVGQGGAGGASTSGTRKPW